MTVSAKAENEPSSRAQAEPSNLDQAALFYKEPRENLNDEYPLRIIIYFDLTTPYLIWPKKG